MEAHETNPKLSVGGGRLTVVITSPFAIRVPDSVLDDLRERLARSRFADPTPGPPWAAGTDPGYLRELVRYWANGFDWRAVERSLNAYPQYVADIDGGQVHFVHVPAVGPAKGFPLVLTHGWPSTFTEMLPLVGLLTDPGSHGADPADAFDVVIPSLPGYTFSDVRADAPATEPVTAELWAKLMTDVLGYQRFGAFGGDIGSGVSTWLGVLHPERVAGIFSHHPKYPPSERRTNLSPAEEAFVQGLSERGDEDGAYAHIQETRPDTLAAALIDSPVGLAAWIVEKFQRWGDCHGDVTSRFTMDDLLTMVTLYWATDCVGTSFRPYRDDSLTPALPLVQVPTGFILSVEDAGIPREFAERVYTDIRMWQEPSRGGHFIAIEEPELIADGLRTFFRPLRYHSDATT
ncbi:MAG TPA: epoxide hydrolase [Micromonosporaceae bacterium]|nr:epoxide hydrolase [Micromonosporaceae bacterium]